MTTTPNLGLKKPATSEPIDVAPINDNSDTLDAFAGEVNESLDGKQDTLTFDAAPTEGSTNPVTSGGVKTDQDRQDALEAADRAALVELVDGGAKNLLRFDGISSRSGATTINFTYNGDGSITVDGYTGDSTAYVLLQFNGANFDAIQYADGAHIIAGVPSGQSGLTLRCQISSDIYGIDTGGGGIIGEASSGILRILCHVTRNTTLSNVTVYPMICTKAAWDISQKIVPYRPSWDELVSRIEALENS